MMLDAPLAPDPRCRSRRPDRHGQRRAASRSSTATCIPRLRSVDDLKAFLPTRWREHLEIYGSRRKLGMSYEPYPKSAPRACRRDAWPETAAIPARTWT